MARTRISNITILALRGLNREAKQRIADRAGVTIFTFYRWINSNSADLTRVDLLKAISEETGTAVEDIIEEVTVDTVGQK